MASNPLCLCGNCIFEPNTSCSPCLQTQRQRPSRRSNGTPPPRYRDNSANQALTSAFSSEEAQPVFLPPNLYRAPARPSSRPGNSSPTSDPASPRLEVGTRASLDGEEARAIGADRSQRATTPEASPRVDARSYSPMSASFARLGAGDSSALPAAPLRRRWGSAKEGTDLSARMFAGPA